MSRLYWSNLPDAKRPRGGTSGLWSSLTTDGLADTGVAGNEHQLRSAAGYDAVEGRRAGFDLGCSPVQLLGNQQPVRRVVLAEREFVDAALRLPIRQDSAEDRSRRPPPSGSAPRPSWRAAS